MTEGLIEELERIVAQGTILAADAEATVPEVRQWIQDRQSAFGRLEVAAAELADDERRAVGRLCAELVGLDGVILPGLGRRLARLGRELAGARKMQRALGAAQAPRSSIVERRI